MLTRARGPPWVCLRHLWNSENQRVDKVLAACSLSCIMQITTFPEPPADRWGRPREAEEMKGAARCHMVCVS